MVNKKEKTVSTAAKPVPGDKHSMSPKPKPVSTPTTAVEEDTSSDAESDSSQGEAMVADRAVQVSADERKLIQLIRRMSKPAAAESATVKAVVATPASASTPVVQPARGSRLELKEIHEVWDPIAYKYKLKEPASPTSTTELETYAFVYRVRILKSDEQRIYYVDIHAPGLRDILRHVLQEAHWLSLGGDKLELEQNLLYHYLPAVQTYLDQSSQDKSCPSADRDALRYLLTTMTTRTADTTTRLQSLLQDGKITYELLWALFKPNTLVLTTCLGSQQVRCLRFQLAYEDKTAQGVERLALQCEYVDYDGNILGWVTENVHLDRFRGATSIVDLPVYPIDHYPDPQIHTVLRDRGHRFVQLMGCHHRVYNGTAFQRVKDEFKRLTIQSEIMVDAHEFGKTQPGYARLTTRQVEVDYLFSQTTLSHRVIDRGLHPTTFSSDELMVCPPTVLGCGLGFKFWGEFVVNHIHPIQWPAESLARVAIPAKDKTTLTSVTHHYFCPSHEGSPLTRTTSIVRRGIRVLLHGPPGVGKTLTAQALAHHYRRPLYSISSADLSSDPRELDVQLPQFFRAADKWKAVLLLDEADIFLQARTPIALERNRLVGIFLQRLEHFQGVMILTTNRIDDIDSAVLDRLLLRIKYNSLDPAARYTVLRSLLHTTHVSLAKQTQGFDEAFLRRFAKVRIDGRQIANIFVVAHTLAEYANEPFCSRHLEDAMTTSGLVIPREDEEDLYA